MDPERRSGPYISILANPDRNEFYKLLKSSQVSILDVGCGETNPQMGVYPRCSWKAKEGTLWIGCDPKAKAENKRVLIHQSHNPRPEEMVFFTREVDTIPQFSPDYISLVAPNPQDIVEGLLYQLDNFLQKATVIIILDNRTQEAKMFGRKAKSAIFKWAKENKLRHLAEWQKPDIFLPNSADLGSNNSLFVFKK